MSLHLSPRLSPRLLRAAVALVAAATILVLNPGVAEASGTWGPLGTTYLNGSICAGGTEDLALVSWPSPDAAPAFATAAVTRPADGRAGRTVEPAVNGVSSPGAPAEFGPTQSAALAYLIDNYGGDQSAGLVTDVAARVLEESGADPAVTDCLARHIGGSSAEVDNQLWNQALKEAGPYTVSVDAPVSTLRSGSPVAITAHVTSALGAPVTGMQVDFTTDPEITASTATATTDARGRATITVGVDPSATASVTRIGASISATTDLVTTSAPATVPILSAAPASIYNGSLRLAVDTRADPVLAITTDHTLLLADQDLDATLGVTGMHGHAGSATVTAYGPLNIDPATGCGGHTAAEWARTRTPSHVAGSANVVIDGDGSYPVALTSAPAGCYQLAARIQTTDATPVVTRSRLGPKVAVAAISVAVTPGGHGVQGIGQLTATLTGTGQGYRTTWQNVDAQVLGPRPSAAGHCPLDGWDGARQAAATAGSGGSASVTLTSSAVHSTGCYAFSLAATLVLPGIGQTAVTLEPGAADAALVVIAPTVTAISVTRSGVASGKPARATVALASTASQPGVLQLQLVYLPYTDHGCFAEDWRKGAVQPLAAGSPAVRTAGDATYTVNSPVLPRTGCWTVVPVFHAAANPAVTASATAGADPMLAFTGVLPVQARQRDTGATSASTVFPVRVAVTGALVALLLALTTLRIVAVARRVRPLEL